MNKNYEIACKIDDPEITIKLPGEILKDLVLRAQENGTSIEIEIAIRLARTLERDLEMVDMDNQLCYAAFKMLSEPEEQ